jgi:hypothetical protein
MEENDYWFRASNKGEDADPLPTLTELKLKNSNIGQLERYNRIHMDYGYPRRERV